MASPTTDPLLSLEGFTNGLHAIFTTLPLFNTLAFALAFTAFYGVYVAAAGWRGARPVLIATFNIGFYYAFGGTFVLMLLGAALTDYFSARGMHLTRGTGLRNLFLAIPLVLNIGLLIFFKYAFFFSENYHAVFGGSVPAGLASLALPVGISFHTFRSISYLLDVYREDEDPEQNFLDYFCYLSFFPTLLAGPITRSAEVLPTLKNAYTLSDAQAARAFFLFFTGLFKKVVIADFLADNFINRVFDAPASFTGIECLIANYAYGIHLYCDFSGYTDMALGLALVLGFDLKGNFKSPFKAVNISDFWRRWHISLSTWFTDYVFMPLNYSWRSWGTAGMALAAILTFLLSGLWHGAAWTFVLWGLAHGLAIAYETYTQPTRKKLSKKIPAKLYQILSILLTFHFLTFTYILFRNKDLATAAVMTERIFTAFAIDTLPAWIAGYTPVAGMLLGGVILHYLPERVYTQSLAYFTRLHWSLRALVCAVIVLIAYQVQSAESLPFVYLKF